MSLVVLIINFHFSVKSARKSQNSTNALPPITIFMEGKFKTETSTPIKSTPKSTPRRSRGPEDVTILFSDYIETEMPLQTPEKSGASFVIPTATPEQKQKNSIDQSADSEQIQNQEMRGLQSSAGVSKFAKSVKQYYPVYQHGSLGGLNGTWTGWILLRTMNISIWFNIALTPRFNFVHRDIHFPMSVYLSVFLRDFWCWLNRTNYALLQILAWNFFRQNKAKYFDLKIFSAKSSQIFWLEINLWLKNLSQSMLGFLPTPGPGYIILC